jgi:hypothetical protein
MASGGETTASWDGLGNAWSPEDWLRYVQIPNFLSVPTRTGAIAVSQSCPFVRGDSSWFVLFDSTLWVIAGLFLIAASGSWGPKRLSRLLTSEKRGWFIVGCCLLIGGIVGPQTLGAHGGFLRERLLLIGLVCVAPLLRFDSKRLGVRIGAVLLATSAIIQVAFIWDYGAFSNRQAGYVMQAQPFVRDGGQIGYVLAGEPGPFRINPLLNLGNMLGTGSDTVVLNNYGPAYYYFPLKFKNDRTRDRSLRLHGVNTLFASSDAKERVERNPSLWANPMGDLQKEIDLLVLVGSSPRIEEVNESWFAKEPIFEGNNVRVFKHR